MKTIVDKVNCQSRASLEYVNVKKTPQERLLTARILLLANVLRRGANMRYRRELDLSSVEWGVVAQLGFSAPLTVNQLSHELSLEKAQISRTVSALVDRRLLDKQTRASNNREVQISLTPAGKKCFEMILELGGEANDYLFAGLKPGQREYLASIIDLLIPRARELVEHESNLTITELD